MDKIQDETEWYIYAMVGRLDYGSTSCRHFIFHCLFASLSTLSLQIECQCIRFYVMEYIRFSSQWGASHYIFVKLTTNKIEKLAIQLFFITNERC